jgi:hypothetical protein
MTSPLVALTFGIGLGFMVIPNTDPRAAIAPVSYGATASLPPGAAFHWPNERLGRALREIEQIDMTPNPDPTSYEKLREARAGGMYGLDASA